MPPAPPSIPPPPTSLSSSIHRAAPSHLFAFPRVAPPAREGRWRADSPPPVLGSDGGA
ncbi:Os01g0361000 [Oryza sativa Japonica Group]|uniref:Os01g0361000 protein n=1 Tax=Oryza sativa subsp. japonica TaxID=39947 RepID=A0A0P0V2E6_ORYSJ|nr:hypothetical protein EE612_003418 [Oryza sativa]BAS72101.1 Os01g0361000 [Oryza sativa Japonica Group]